VKSSATGSQTGTYKRVFGVFILILRFINILNNNNNKH